MKLLQTFLFLLAATAFLQAQVSNGLVAKYSFDNGNADDEVGVVDGTVNNAVLDEDRFGNMNKSYRFDGQGSNGHILLSDPIISLTTDFTITHWFYVNAVGSEFQYTLQSRKNVAGAEQGGVDFLIPDASKVFVTFRRESAGQLISVMDLESGIQLQKWSMLSLKRSGNIVTLKLDDVLVDSDTLTSGLFQTPQIWSMGSSYRANNDIARELDGNIDDVQFFNRALTDAEETLVFNAANPTLSILTPPQLHVLGRLFPNPVNTRLQLHLDNSAVAQIRIFNSLGQLVQERETNDIVTELDFSAFRAGLYSVEIFQDGKCQVERIIKQ